MEKERGCAGSCAFIPPGVPERRGEEIYLLIMMIPSKSPLLVASPFKDFCTGFLNGVRTGTVIISRMVVLLLLLLLHL